MFLISASIMALLILFCTFYTDEAEVFFNQVQKEIIASFSWLFTLATSFFLLFSLFLIISPFGKIRLGQSGDRPEFSTFTWFAMLFSAGMGIGLESTEQDHGFADPVLYFLHR